MKEPEVKEDKMENTTHSKQFISVVKLCLQLDNQRDLPGHRAAMLLLISLSEVEPVVTYQRSFFIRACRAWNVLPAELRTSHISLASFT